MQAGRHRDAANELVAQLETHAEKLGLDETASTRRLATARAAKDLLVALDERRPAVEIVELLARADLGGPADRTGRSISSAAQVSAALATAPWDNFDIVEGLMNGEYGAEATAILATLRGAAQADELTTPLAPALRRAQTDATALLRRATRKPKDPDPDPRDETDDDGEKKRVTGQITVTADEIDPALVELRTFVARHPGATIEVSWRIVP
jgi:hypothetical protein